MERVNSEDIYANNEINKSNNSSSRSRSRSHISMSDTESQLESFHSPLPSLSPSNSNALVLTVDKYLTASPHKPPSEHISFPPTPVTGTPLPPIKHPDVVYNFNRGGGGREGVRKVELRDEEVGRGEQHRGEGQRKSLPSIFKTNKVKKSGLALRLCQMVACLVSFSVMAADKTQGWAGDSFDRYKEYRYCLAVNVIGFVYAGFQAFSLAFNLASGKHIISHHLHYHFEFLMDQILAYLLMSASSSAATRVDDWVSNWGKDKFTEMATASIGMSFLAFFTFAISSLMSGYNLCNRDTN